MQSRPSGAGSERGDGRSLSPRRPAPNRRKRGARGGGGGGGGGAEAGASTTLRAWALVVRLPGLEAGSGPSANECQLW